jgi:L-asparaginase
MKIKLLLTGGTIDKVYNELEENLIHSKTHVQRMLEQGRCKADIEMQEVMLVDSDRMTDEQRHHILEVCQSADTNRIVITHGTGTMAKTAHLLGENMRGKTIILVGAMIPYMVGNSDALFNLGAAITAVQLLDPGVYITMNGKVFGWENVTKNKEIGEFVTLD